MLPKRGSTTVAGTSMMVFKVVGAVFGIVVAAIAGILVTLWALFGTSKAVSEGAEHFWE